MRTSTKRTIIVTSLYPGEPKNPKTPKFGGVYYRERYEVIRRALEPLGIRFVRSPLSSYREGKFHAGWEFAHGSWKRLRPYRPQIIWDKSRFSYSHFELKKELARKYFYLCHPKFGQIAYDKYLTSLIFSEHSPQTVFVKSPRELERAAKLLVSSRVVLKPNTESGGKGIQIVKKSELKPSMIKGPTILQAFVETSSGVPGIAKGRHDLRVEMFNDSVFRSYIRIAKKGKLLANLHQGGRAVWVPQSRIPSSILKIIAGMQPKIRALYPLYYTVDFLFDSKGKPFITEINHTPGVDFPVEGFSGSEENVWRKYGRFLLREYAQWKKY